MYIQINSRKRSMPIVLVSILINSDIVEGEGDI